MGCENSANDVLVDVDTESQGNLLGNARASPTWIALLHFNNGTNQIRAWAFRSRPRSAFCGKQKPVFSMNQSAMKVEKRRWFHRDCGSYQSSRQHKYGAQSGDKPVRGAEIRPSLSGTIQNQQLMPEQNGFGENCPHASGTNQTNKDGDDMDE
jgi:hypothetical protein